MTKTQEFIKDGFVSYRIAYPFHQWATFQALHILESLINLALSPFGIWINGWSTKYLLDKLDEKLGRTNEQ